MSIGGVLPAIAKAAETFDSHENRSDGLEIARSLASGMTALRESLLRRLIESDQQSTKDSMLVPSSQLKAQQMAAEEVEAYLIAESAAAADQGGYVRQVDPWYTGWLISMRLDSWNPLSDVRKRVTGYLQQAADKRRLEFSNVLVRVLPEARRAPLVLFRLLPAAAQIATAQAFKDQKSAQKLRREQIKLLPAIGYCKRCHGKLLDGIEKCTVCGNPLWTCEWLCAID